MEDQSLFGWLPSEEGSDVVGGTPFMSEYFGKSFSVALYGGSFSATLTTEPPDHLPLPVDDPLHIESFSSGTAVSLQECYCNYSYHFQGHYSSPLDDFNFDSFHWDDSPVPQEQPNGDDTATGMSAVSPSCPDQYSVMASAAYNVNVGTSWVERNISGGILQYVARQLGERESGPLEIGEGSSLEWPAEKQGPPSMSSLVKLRPTSSMIGFDEVSKYFCMPIIEAAKCMKVGLTVLKKRCRELGISRWPHRKMKSLNSLIRNFQELGNGVASQDCIAKEVETLEEQKRMIQVMPEMQLSGRTKRLRQACFKANFKKRRAAATRTTSQCTLLCSPSQRSGSI